MDLAGRQVGPYRLLTLIGRGGTAEVYKAFHPALERQVAIKVLLQEASQDPDWVRRFHQEAHLLGQLDHPHILPIYDAGEYQGRPYLVMKYVANGVTLRSQLTGRPWPLDRVAMVLDQVSAALQAAHEHGVVHRDVKPSNILVTPDSRCLVFDFGIAKPYRRIDTPTGEGLIVGTPEFMSPEQCKGEKLDHRSDVYSMGIMTYQLLTGRVPFTAETAVGILMKHLTEPIPIPPQEVVLTPQLNKVLTRSLARSPQDRYPSVADFNQALQESAGVAPTVTIAAKALAKRTYLWKRWVVRLQTSSRRVLAFSGVIALAVGLSSLFLGRRLLPSLPESSQQTEATMTNTANLSDTSQTSHDPAPITDGQDEGTPHRPEHLAKRIPPLKPGFLSIETDRPAAVILDGQHIGSAPGQFRSVPPGRHHLKLNAGEDSTWEKDILISSASTTYVRMTFPEKIETGLSIASEGKANQQVTKWRSRVDTITRLRRWEGFLTDGNCLETGGLQGALHLKCALRCIQGGKRPMLYTEGRLYYIDGFELIQLKDGAPLIFWGRLDAKTKTIHVGR